MIGCDWLLTMKILFLFLDGVGLGEDNPDINPFVRASMPNLTALLGGSKFIADGHNLSPRSKKYILQTDRATLLSLDACLGVKGIPQSATGQAALLTGKNVAAMLGQHDGPKPSPAVIEILKDGTLLSQASGDKCNVALLNAYPPRYFQAIDSGYRLPGVIALSARYAGLHLRTMHDLVQGQAISADFTADGWRTHLGFEDTPVLNPNQAGERLYELSNEDDLSIFEYWLTDMAGHHQDMPMACSLLELFDQVLGSLVNAWDDNRGLILLTSDHGNLEDMSTRHHTLNLVPLLLIGSTKLRKKFLDRIDQGTSDAIKPDLTTITPSIMDFIR
jgi:2,3-bisphosphoglycerate-independent phosphoglycerate mutase